MKKFVCSVILGMSFVVCDVSHAANWIRSGDVGSCRFFLTVEEADAYNGFRLYDVYFTKESMRHNGAISIFLRHKWLGAFLLSLLPIIALVSHMQLEASFGSLSKVTLFFEIFSIGAIIVWGIFSGLSDNKDQNTLRQLIFVRKPFFTLLVSCLFFTVFVFVSFVIQNPGPGFINDDLSSFQKISINLDFWFVLMCVFLILPFVVGYVPAKIFVTLVMAYRQTV